MQPQRNSPEAALYARAYFSYDPTTGILCRTATQSNNAKIGPVTTLNAKGYLKLTIGQHTYAAHRVIWLLVHGEWPSGEIDHINGIPTDNRLCNLRLATASQNQANIGLRKDNKTGFKGVGLDKKSGKFTAKIKSRGVCINLGRFATAELAYDAYTAAANAIHGEFARVK